MKNKTVRGLVLLALGAAALVACAGTKAREVTLLPAVRKLFDEVVLPAATRGAEAAATDAEQQEAVQQVLVALPAVRDALVTGMDAVAELTEERLDVVLGAAMFGIETRVGAGEIGAAVAMSLKRAVVVWRASCEILTGRTGGGQ